MNLKRNLYITGFFLLFLSFELLAQQYEKIESVEYDAKRNRFLVSNSTSIIERKANGTLAYFGEGATATHGMEIFNDQLFAISSKTIKGYNLEDGKEVMSLSIDGAGFLNGMAHAGEGILYVTDFSAKKIYKINVSDTDNPGSEVWIENTSTTPNGIVYDEMQKRLVFVSWGSNAPVKAIDLTTKEITVVKETTLSNCDGIDTDTRGNFYVSSWSPQRITKYKNDFSDNGETIQAQGLNNPADICYAKEIDTLAIPNVGSTMVTFVGFDSTTGLKNKELDGLNFSVYPNPVRRGNNLNIELINKVLSFDLLSIDGRIIHSFNTNDSKQKTHQISTKALNKGIYFIRLNFENNLVKMKMIYCN